MKRLTVLLLSLISIMSYASKSVQVEMENVEAQIDVQACEKVQNGVTALSNYIDLELKNCQRIEVESGFMAAKRFKVSYEIEAHFNKCQSDLVKIVELKVDNNEWKKTYPRSRAYIVEMLNKLGLKSHLTVKNLKMTTTAAPEFKRLVEIPECAISTN